MMLRHVGIEHFRGIRAAKWKIDRRLVALVGAGDSTKTTLMDAIGLVLSPSYTTQFTDADFYEFDITNNIVIEAVVTELPDGLVKESQLGKDRSGLMPDGTLVHDPVDDAEECLIVRLTVTKDLEPTWAVVRPGSDDIRPISASQRRRLGFFRLGERPDYHLRWARGSALSALTDGGDGASSVIVDAHRQARAAVFEAEPNALHTAAATALSSASVFGAAVFDELRPGLEPGSATSTHALLLHHGSIPLSSLGLGTRRLTSLAIQDQAMESGSIIAIDEIEHGLEPHRLSQALYRLRQRTDANRLQIILTTHSPVVVKALSATDIQVVHADGTGSTTCRPVPVDLENVQGTLRSAPEALLGRRIIVGEGATEVGFMRTLLRQWDEQRLQEHLNSTAAVGVVLVNGGGGAQSLQRAKNFHMLGYSTCALLDNDDTGIAASAAAAEVGGIALHRWSQGFDIEHEIIHTLSMDGVQALVDLAVEFRSEESVRAVVSAKLGSELLVGTDVAAWQKQAGIDDEALRSAIADAAVVKEKEWFKREDRGEEMAGIVLAHWADLTNTHLLSVLNELQAFAYPEPTGSASAGDAHPVR
ncbi:ATP-binding protein [Ammonicoccus fulvus]|uniref:ATP-binding protein n=1 Tax=Ammonicoccus fulvus TaxID=3138240 RepID=A0ABZ3FRU5_9ACTN